MSILKNHMLVSLILVIVGCTEVLHTDFNSNGGPWTSGALSGLPAGDSVEVQGNVVGTGSCVTLPNSSAASLDLITGGKPHNTSGYAISSSGIKLTIDEIPIIVIDALDSRGRIACGLEISGGEFRLVSGDGENVIGEYTGNADVHRIFMRLNNLGGVGTATCGVRIEQVLQASETDVPTVPLITALAPLITQEFQELDRLRVGWENTPGTSATQYFLCHVTINKDN